MYCRGKEAEKLFVSPPFREEDPYHAALESAGGPSENGCGSVTF